jgi:hypothetical protein
VRHYDELARCATIIAMTNVWIRLKITARQVAGARKQ